VERIVEKIIQVSDNTQINELLLKIQQLENRQPEIVEVIKEVTVEKSNDKTLMLQETLVKLRLEIVDKTKKIEELENKIKTMESNMSQPAFYLKGSNLNQKM
jgi:predicted  nucleic acid-binding Zn-ribbon protein